MILYLKKILAPYVYPIIKNSFSSSGEDRIVLYLFQSLKVDKPSYLDLGANHPLNGNNTFLFYKDGGKGVCVEAQPALCRLIKSARPRDTCLNVAVGVNNSQDNVKFYVFDQVGVSTMDSEEADKRIKGGKEKLREIIEVPLLDINTIIKTNFKTYPEFLSVDIEGLDVQVIKSLDLESYPIPVICVEIVEYSTGYKKTSNSEVEDYLTDKGYFLYADTYINSIFVNLKWFNSFN